VYGPLPSGRGSTKDVLVNNAGRLSARFSSTLIVALIAGALYAQAKPDLSSLSVDELMNVEVTSVAKRGEKLFDTAAAVFVITQDDIRRSGATCIPEVLRIVPGLDVARINGNIWAITARGSNGQFANKLLVMIDGRSVYTPLFSGVYWDVQDTLLEDIDRIEVIRGPGGTLWGANAVNGVINIITKHAIETQGTLISAGAGGTNGTSTAGRFGGSVGHNGYYRAYAKASDRPASITGADPTHDAFRVGRGGFRSDWASQRGDNFTAQGDIYRGNAGTVGILVDPDNAFGDRVSTTRVAGQDLQFRWAATQSSRSDTTLQVYYDFTSRTDPGLVIGRRTFDIDFQHHLKLGTRNDTVWGADYRLSIDHAHGPGLELIRDSNSASIASVFLQDDIQVAPRFRVTLGTKVLYSAVSHLELQPTLRVLFKASETQTIWAAATSAVREPSEAELYGRLILGAFPDGTANGGIIVVSGNTDLKPERVNSLEIGYRWQVDPKVGLDVTAFHNEMRNLSGSLNLPPYRDASGRTIVPIGIETNGRGHADGAEFLLTDAVTTKWNVALGYSFFQLYATDDEGLPSSGNVGRMTTPRHQLQFRTSIELAAHVEVDSSAYYVSHIANTVPSYLRLDGQLSWRPAKRWELSIAGQNLLRAHHNEFAAIPLEDQGGTPVQRTVSGKVTWRY
jgi:iron complex outermembrane recepter protein